MAADSPEDRPSDDDKRRREFFVQGPLGAASALQKHLPIDEAGYLHVVGHVHGDARAYYLYGVLDEVVKTSVAGIRWQEYVDEPAEAVEKKKAESRDAAHIGRLVEASVLDEQEMWVRKLIEILVDVVLFATTNEQEFYRLYLVCRQLDAYVGLQADFEEFYAFRSGNADETIRLLQRDIEGIRDRIDFGRAWFLADGIDLRRLPRPGGAFRSVRQRFMRAQAIADSDLRLVLGTSYEMGYSTPSRSVHPNVGGPTRDFTRAEVERNMAKIGILGIHIAVAAYGLAGITPEGAAAQTADALRQSIGGDMFRRMFQRQFDLGDIVFAYGDDLCQIVETARSKYGNTSYKVRYLARRPIPEIGEDWFPSQHIRLLYRNAEIKPKMIEAVRQTGIGADRIAELERIPDEKVAGFLADAFTLLEREGVLRLMLRPPGNTDPPPSDAGVQA